MGEIIEDVGAGILGLCGAGAFILWIRRMAPPAQVNQEYLQARTGRQAHENDRYMSPVNHVPGIE